MKLKPGGICTPVAPLAGNIKPKPEPAAAPMPKALGKNTVCVPVVIFKSRLPCVARASTVTLIVKLVLDRAVTVLVAMPLVPNVPTGNKNWTKLLLVKLVLVPVIVTVKLEVLTPAPGGETEAMPGTLETLVDDMLNTKLFVLVAVPEPTSKVTPKLPVLLATVPVILPALAPALTMAKPNSDNRVWLVEEAIQP